MTIRQALAQFRLGCHDTLCAFWLYRICHGKHWAQHKQSGWYVISLYRYEHLLTASDRGSIIEIEDNSDPWQIWGVRIVTGIIAVFGVMVAVILS